MPGKLPIRQHSALSTRRKSLYSPIIILSKRCHLACHGVDGPGKIGRHIGSQSNKGQTFFFNAGFLEHAKHLVHSPFGVITAVFRFAVAAVAGSNHYPGRALKKRGKNIGYIHFPGTGDIDHDQGRRQVHTELSSRGGRLLR